MQDILEQLPYSAKNLPNVKSILKKLTTAMKVERLLKKDFKDTNKLADIIKESVKPSKYAEATQVLYQVGKVLGVKPKYLEALANVRDQFRETRLEDYKNNAKYIPDNFNEVKDMLKKYFDSDDILTRRLAKFYYAFGGIRQGEIRNTKIVKGNKYPRDTAFNYFMLKDKDWLIHKHKNAHRTSKSRELKLPQGLIDESEDSENGTFYLTGTMTPANASKLTRVFKSLTGITMKDWRHMEAEAFKYAPTKKQKEVSEKNGHSLSTMRLIYSNAFTNGDISQTMVDDAKRHYERLLKKWEEQQASLKEFNPAD